MSFWKNWLKNRTVRTTPARRPMYARLGLEGLEERAVPAVSSLSITSLNGTLVSSPGAAAVVSPGDTVTVAFSYKQ